ncbi:galactarate dehydratase [Terribacillus saccharophilus]|uniref:galactarate dehydratase n=1 Tax=Terribacillus saccharophilus TaxID=361277 RepID=UPI000BA74056|nr:galactarate dehydratase [Terribacillus saccharophilus]PAF18692.1 galactarate dehydratase [Terribacillus saccharophilus]PAF36937.1 galactarate dehydratase [Terribacillus saccharophilus]
MQLKSTTNPYFVKVHEQDNVAIAVADGGLAAGTSLAGNIVTQEHIPQGHKLSLQPIHTGESVIRYGEVIGHATTDITTGSWVQERHLLLPTPPPLDELSLSPAPADPLPTLEGYTFEGYRNLDGSVGTKNILGIITSVQCVVGVMDHAVKRLKQDILPNYPNVDDIVGLHHAYGCGVAIQAPEAIIPIRTVQNLARHPNFGGETLVIGLGCEKLIPSRVNPSGKDEDIILLQDQQGFHAMVAKIIEKAEAKLVTLNKRKRETCPVSELVIGTQCGGSDAFSGVTANPAVGYASDLLVRAGATVMFSEVTEVRDAIHLLTPRANSKEVAEKLVREMDWYDRYLASGQADRSANPSPGNKKGGLSNVVEKALGSVAKSGQSTITDVLAPGERAETKGLLFAATPASDFVCGTLQLASGIHMQLFTTGRGTPYSLAMAPVVKISTRTALHEQWKDLIDINAGTIATGEATLEEVGWEIFHFILDVASGRKQTWADHWDTHNDLALFNPAPVT